jgi:hypothetical protein
VRCVYLLDGDVLAFELSYAEFREAPVVVEVFSLCRGGVRTMSELESSTSWIYQAKIGRD